MRIATLICRILLGLGFIAFGIMGILHLPKMPPPPPNTLPGQYMAVMGPSGWSTVVAVCQVLGGVLVLLGRTAPLGLCILGPILVNIWCFHLLLTHGAGMAPGAVCTLLFLVVLYGYRANFSGILTTSAQPTD